MALCASLFERTIRLVWRDGRVAEGGGLLNRCTVKSRTGGSNPPLSASLRSELCGERRLPRRSAAKAGHASGANLRATTRQASMSFHYVYILQNDYSQYYVRITEDLKARLKKHNRGEVPHTSKFRPWSIKTAIAFTSEERARDFEKYLKTASGRAFAKKRL